MGLPLNMDGTEGRKAHEARKMADLVKKSLSIDLELTDERLTTVQAVMDLHRAQGKVGKSRKRINMMAAMIILQDYLDSLRA